MTKPELTLLSELELTLRSAKCRGEAINKDNMCYQENCEKCQALRKIRVYKLSQPEASTATNENNTALMDKAKTKLLSFTHWVKNKKNKTIADVITELKKLGVYKNG